jgi:hypothetical protein
MTQNYKMPMKYNTPRKYHGHCEQCGKEVPQNEICKYLDGNNVSITYYSQYLCKECYEERYGKQIKKEGKW